VDECLTPQLAAALRVQIGVDEKILATDNDDYDPAHLAGYIELAALEEQETERRRRRWFIRLELHPLKGYYQTLHGPNAYTVLLPSQRYHGARLDDALLDAIDAYTEWMSHAEQRAEAEREEQRRKQAEREEQQAKQPEPRHFTSIVGGQAGGLLDRGNRVRVRARNPDAEGGTLQFAAGVETSSDTWLLLNVGGTQRLVPVAQVIDITPLPDLAPDLAPSDAQ
jgi:hypothetical protein